ncbi:MAG TPA: hypothetical protein PKM25_13555 [Candidatus Ozemobacteraceae bacterium]|nr:hypothetical protein [Candidatus Ozemobacteraceae bacterium]
MSDESEKKNPFEKIDPSDVRVLAIGLILLFIPLVFLFFQSRQSGGGFAAGGVKDRLASGRGGFSFIQKSAAGKQVPAASLYSPPKAEKQWSDIVQRVTTMPMPARMFEGYPPTTKELLQAQFDPRIRQANLLMEEGNAGEGMKILKAILEEETDNPFLHLTASQRLCRFYQTNGMKDQEEKEFMRLLEIMGKIPEMKNIAQYMRGCMEFVRKSPDLLAKYADNPAVKAYLQEMSAKPGMPLNSNQVMNQTSNILSNLSLLAAPHSRK